MSNHINCPNCQSAWGFEEIQFQECDCCGWPDPECENFMKEADNNPFIDEDIDPLNDSSYL